MDSYADFTDEQRAAVQMFFDRVCRRAESNMAKTSKLEGAHYAAMRAEIEAMSAAGAKPPFPDPADPMDLIYT